MSATVGSVTASHGGEDVAPASHDDDEQESLPHATHEEDRHETGEGEEGGEAATTAVPCLELVRDILRRAERDWQQGQRVAAIAAYDEALQIAKSEGNSALEGQILLGKGFALMQPALAHKQADFVQEEARNRTSLAIDAAAGLECLQQTLAIAEAAGHAAQVMFVKKLIEERGYFALPSAASCSGHDEAEGSACAENDTEAIAKAVARGDDPEELSDTDGDATEEQVSIGSPNHRTNHPKQVGLSTTVSRSRRKRALWTAQDEERLITFVADDGVEEDAWENKAERLREQRDGCSFSAADVRARWISIAPRVKEELKRQDALRACGHTCGTCPTRPTCKLHDALDVKVVNDW